jgi:hypothetical protein
VLEGGEKATKSESLVPDAYQYFWATPLTIKLASIETKRTASGIPLFAVSIASCEDMPLYGPVQYSTGTGFSGLMPNGSSRAMLYPFVT